MVERELYNSKTSLANSVNTHSYKKICFGKAYSFIQVGISSSSELSNMLSGAFAPPSMPPPGGGSDSMEQQEEIIEQ